MDRKKKENGSGNEGATPAHLSQAMSMTTTCHRQPRLFRDGPLSDVGNLNNEVLSSCVAPLIC